MSTTLQASRESTAVPLNLSVSKGGGVAGLTATVAIRDGATSDSYLDFADNTFKTVGWTTKKASMADVGGGFYTRTGGLNVSAFTNLPAGSTKLVAEYEVSGALAGVTLDVIELTGSDMLEFIHAVSKNRLEVNFATQKLELYDAAGLVVIQSWPLETNGGENVTTSTGVQTKRKNPEL